MNFKNLKISQSAIFLVISNLITIYIAVSQHWDVGKVMWIYFIQTVTIGVFNYFKIQSLKVFRTDGLLVNGHPIEPNSAYSKDMIAVFFLLHYGMFQFAYGLYLHSNYYKSLLGLLVDPFFFPTVGIFIANHYFSYVHNKESDAVRNLNIGTLMFYPYIRFLPTYLLMGISASMGGGSLILFMFVKTLADLATHAVEHSMGVPQPAVANPTLPPVEDKPV